MESYAPALGLGSANDDPSPRVLSVMAVSKRWTLGCGASEAEVFLDADQVSGPHGGGGSGGWTDAVSLSMGEQRLGSSTGRSVGLLPTASGPSGGERERRMSDAVEAPAVVGARWGKCHSLFFKRLCICREGRRRTVAGLVHRPS